MFIQSQDRKEIFQTFWQEESPGVCPSQEPVPHLLLTWKNIPFRSCFCNWTQGSQHQTHGNYSVIKVIRTEFLHQVRCILDVSKQGSSGFPVSEEEFNHEQPARRVQMQAEKNKRTEEQSFALQKNKEQEGVTFVSYRQSSGSWSLFSSEAEKSTVTLLKLGTV